MLNSNRQELKQLHLVFAGGASASGNGHWEKDTGELRVNVRSLDLRALHTAMQTTRLDGPAVLSHVRDTQRISLELAGQPYGMSVAAAAEINPAEFVLRSARARAGDATFDVKGRLQRNDSSHYEIAGQLTDFNPARFLRLASAASNQRLPADIRINMDLQAAGRLKPSLESEVHFAIHDSTYAGLPMRGKGTLAIKGKQLLPSDAQLEVAGNSADLQGSFGAPRDSVKFRIDAPALDRLAIGAAGRLHAQGTLAGSTAQPAATAQWDASQLRFGNYAIERAAGDVSFDARTAAIANAPAHLKVSASGVRAPGVMLARADAAIDGTYARHRIVVATNGRLHDKPLDLNIDAVGGLEKRANDAWLDAKTAWRGTLGQFSNRGFPAFALTRPASIYAAADRLELGTTAIDIERARVDLRELAWQPGELRTAGRVHQLNVGHLLTLQQEFTGKPAPAASNMVLDGTWDVQLAGRASGFAEIRRISGDLQLKSNGRTIDAGIESLYLRADFENSRARIDGALATAQFGRVTANGTIGSAAGSTTAVFNAASPLALRLRASVPRLNHVTSIVSARIVADGSLDADITVNGTVGAPLLTGNLRAEKLELTFYDQGIRLHDGTARLALNNNVVTLQEVVFHGGNGTLRASGTLPLDEANPALTATIVADRLQLIADPTRQLTMSGKAVAANTTGILAITGAFTVDRALFDLPDKSAPKLDDDVIVATRDPARTRAGAAPARSSKPGRFAPAVDVKLNLGNDFRFRGSGAALLLGGTLNIRSVAGQAPQAFGNVRVVNGVYEAFGAKLQIQQGIIGFQGPLDNPSLNIIAMRREREVEAGVQVTGNVREARGANRPRFFARSA